MTSTGINHGQRWTAAEDAAITDRAAVGRLAEVAEGMGRTVKAARTRRYKLRARWGDSLCSNPAHELWRGAEDSLIASVVCLYPRRLPAHSVEALAAVLPGRTPFAIKRRISTMRKRL